MQLSKFLVDFSVNAWIFLMTDCWISSNHHVFVEITVHDIFKSWKLFKTLLDFKLLDESHNNVALVWIIFNVLQKFNFLNWFMCITTDNISNNIVMTVILCAELAKTEVMSDYNNLKLKKKLEIVQHLSCLAHVLQLVFDVLLKFIKINSVNDEIQNIWTIDEEVIQKASKIFVTLIKICFNLNWNLDKLFSCSVNINWNLIIS